MPTKNRRERDRARMRRRILDAAKLLFVKEGFDNVSMRRIASAIEYSPAAIYRYFKNKRDILTALREEGFEQFVVGQRERLAAYSDPMERLKVGGRGYVKFAIAQPDYFELMFCTDCRDVDLENSSAQHSMDSYHLFRQTVEECLETGHFGDVDAETAVFSLWASAHGLAHLIKTGRVALMSGDMDMDNLIDSILQFNLRPACSGKGEEG